MAHFSSRCRANSRVITKHQSLISATVKGLTMAGPVHSKGMTTHEQLSIAQAEHQSKAAAYQK